MPRRARMSSGAVYSFYPFLNIRSSQLVLWWAAVAALLLAAGCATNSASLPALPPGQGGSGALSFVSPANQPAAVANRTSTYLLVTTGATGSNAVRCSTTTNGVTVGNNAANCTLTLTPSAVPSSGSLTVDVTASDANSHSSTTQNFVIPVNPPLTIASPSPDPAGNPAVVGRSYGTLTWKASGGIGPYNFSPAAPGGLNCVTNSNTFACSSAAISGTPGPVSFTVSVQDTSNGPTPAAAAPVSAPMNTFTLVLEMSTGWNLAPDNVQAVNGRSYGEVASGQTSPSAPTFTVTNGGGLGGYTYSASVQPGGGIVCAGGSSSLVCQTSAPAHSVSAAGGSALGFSAQVSDTANAYTPSNTISLPTTIHVNSTLAIGLAPSSPNPATSQATAVVGRTFGKSTGCSGSGGNCVPVTYAPVPNTGTNAASATLSASGSQNGISCTSGSNSSACTSATTVTSAAGTISITATDVANAYTPGSASAPFNPAFPQPKAEMTPGWNTDPNGISAVNLRSYGVAGSGQTSATSPTFQVNNAGGLGGYTYSVVSPVGGGLNCPNSSSSLICQAASITAAGGTSITISPQVTDSPNMTTPSNTVPATAPSTVPVNPGIAADFNQAPESNPAVTGRPYGTAGLSATPPTFAVTNAGGLGGYTYSTTGTPPTGISCSAGGPSPIVCKTSGGSVTGTTSTFNVSVVDTPNVYTPSKSNSRPTTINVNGPVTVALGPGSPDPTTAAGIAAQQLSYGQGTGCQPSNSCQPVAFSASGGTGTFSSIVVSGNPPSIPCTPNPTNTTTSCSSGNVTDAVKAYPATVTAQDQPNQFTPAGGPASPLASSFTINPALVTPAPNDTDSASPPDAENGNAYAVGAGIVPLTYNVSGGIGPYTGSCNGVGGLAAPNTSSPTNVTCSGPNITQAAGPATLSVVSHGTPNQTTPAGSSPAFLAPSMMVHLPLTFSGITEPSILGGSTVQQLPNLLLQSDYTGSNSFTFNSTGGVGGLTWVGTNLPTGLNAFGTGNILGGIPSSAQVFACNITVSDAGNTKVPVKTVTLPMNSCPTLDTLAYAANPTSNTVEVIRTTNASGNTPAAVASISMSSASVPTGVAATPDGFHIYVTLLGSNKIAVIDTTTNGQITGSPFSLPSGCTGPKGIAITPDGSRFYVVCSTSHEILAVRTSDNTTVDAAFVLGASSIPDSVAVRPDGRRVYVTQGGTSFNQVFFIDNTATPPATIGTFALTATRPAPMGIAIAPHGAKFYAYIAKQNPGSGNVGAVDVFDVTTDLPTSVASLDTGANTQPLAVAFDPSDPTAAQVYATLSGTDQFAVIDNTANPPTIGTAQNLPDPTLAATDTPAGIAFPPHVAGATAQAYIAISNKNQIDVIDNSAPPTIATGSPVIVLTGTARLAGIAVIPLPH